MQKKREVEINARMLAGMVAAGLLRAGLEAPEFWDVAACGISAAADRKTPSFMSRFFELLTALVKPGPKGREERASAARFMRELAGESIEEALKADHGAREVLRPGMHIDEEHLLQALKPILDRRTDATGFRLAAEILERDTMAHLDAVKRASENNMAMGAAVNSMRSLVGNIQGQSDDDRDDDDEDDSDEGEIQ